MDAGRTITQAIDTLDRAFLIHLLPLAHEADTDDAMRETVEAFAFFYHLRLSLSLMRSTWKDQAAIQQEMYCQEHNLGS
jgi:hypothetical protein